jgi:hypothetical protein
MKIFIPTRARIHKQITRQKFFLDKIPYPVIFVVPESEHSAYLRNWPGSHMLTVPDEFRLSNIRQWLVDTQREDPHHCCFDDDLVFLRRKSPLDVHQRSDMRIQDAIECFQRIEFWLKDGWAHGALSQRSGNNHETGAFKVIGRATDTHFYNAEVIHGEGLKFNDVILRQDFHMTLSLLERGYPNIIDHEFISGQTDGKAGGCEVYRTKEMLEEQAHLLASLHPEFVTVITKVRKTGFGESVDVRIQWVKAFESKMNLRKLPLTVDNEVA